MDHSMRNFVKCCIGGDALVPDMSIANKKVLEHGDGLLASSDGLCSGLTNSEMTEIAAPGEQDLAENPKDLSIKALEINGPYSDNTTGTTIRWLGA